MSPDLQRGWRQSHWLDLHGIEADLTIEPIKCLRETKTKKKTSHKDDEQTNVARRLRNHKIKNEIDVKITCFNKREREKRVRGVILGQKLTLNHSSLVDEGEETRVLVTAHKREREKRKPRNNLFS